MLQYLFNLVFYFRFCEKTPYFSPSYIKKILIIRNDNVGDVVCSTPAIAALRNYFPEAYIALLVQQKTRSIIACNPHLHKIYSYVKPKEAGNFYQRCGLYLKKCSMLWSIRKEKFDITITLKSDFSLSQGLLSFMSGACFRLGHYPHKKKDIRYSFLYNIYVKDSRTGVHEIERCLHILETIGVPSCKKMPEITIPQDLIAGVESFLALHRIRQFMVIHLFSKRDRGLWDEETIIALIEKITARFQLPVCLTYPPSAYEKAKEIRAHCKNNVFSIDTPDILHFCALLKKSFLFISPEGGQVHISSALKIPTIALFFQEVSLLGWEPWSDLTHVLMIEDTDRDTMLDSILQLVQQKMSTAGLLRKR